MDSGGGYVREQELRNWRQEIGRMISAGQRLSVVDDRLNEAALSETERCVLHAIARALARYSYDDDWYREEFGSFDG